MTDEKLTQEWLEQKLEQDRMAEEEAERDRRAEQDRENLRAAWAQQTGQDPTAAQLEQLLADKRQEDVRLAARHNEAVAREQVRSIF
jgi:hypothetical protein